VTRARSARNPRRRTGGSRRHVILGSIVAALLLLAFALPALAATPSPGPGGDPRSSGQGPGLVGDPAFAILAVLLIAAGAVLATLAYVRLTGGRRP
jgi:hypothetical protein